MINNINDFSDVLDDEIHNSQPISLPSSSTTDPEPHDIKIDRPPKRSGECGGLRSIEEIDPKYRNVFSYQYFNLVQSKVIEDALYSDKSMVVCAPTGSGKTVIFAMAIVQLLMEMDSKHCNEDFKIIYMAPIKALCTERLTEWYPKFTKLNLLCIEVTGDTDVEFSQLKPYRIIITTPEKWDMLTRRWRDNRGMVEVIKLFLIDEVHILNDSVRGPVLEAVVSRMKTIQSSVQSAHRIELLQKQNQSDLNISEQETAMPKIRFVAISATISNPEDVAEWLGTSNKPAIYYKFGDECRPVKLKRVVEGYPCPEGTSIFKFDIILNYKLWPLIQKYHDGKPTLIFCNTRKSVLLTAETLSREITINFSPEQKAKLVALASFIKNKKVQSLILCGVGCHHAGLLFEERTNIEQAFRNSDLPILITTTTLAMGVNLPAHLVIIKNTQQYVNGAYQEYSISTMLQMVGRAGRPQFDTEATAVIMTRLTDKARYQALVGGCEPLQSYLHKRLAENLNSEAALGTVNDVAQCVQWLRSTFLFVRAARDPRKYLGLPQTAPSHLISKRIEELCVKAMNGLASSGLITMDEASCIESTEAGRLMSIYYLDLETMKHIMKIKGNESLEQLLWIVCECHELSDMHLRVDERRCLNALNRNNTASTIRFPMKGKINTRQMKLNCLIQAVLGCLPIHEPSLNQEAMKIMRIADRICKCLVAYVTRPNLLRESPQNYQAVLNSIMLNKCIKAHLWENSIYVSKQLKGIGPTFSGLLATAGKVNFMLLEESHPRDLERIMNKGPPAGNILRKQISLLPKYQLTMTPVDKNCLKIQLTLLNQTHLLENIEHLTAGAGHKCYIVIGDSENYLLLLTSFKDKDLISVYDGQITYEIMRRHNFEHKIIAHCISLNFAGIDVQCEYVYIDSHTLSTKDINTTSQVGTPSKAIHVKQTAITDTFKVCKRKSSNVGETRFIEKIKRNYPVIEKIQSLEQHFEREEKEISPNINVMHHKNSIFNVTENDDLNELGMIDEINLEEIVQHESYQNNREIDIENNEDDEQINSILNEIEKEIHGHDLLNKKCQPQSNKLITLNTIERVNNAGGVKVKIYNELGNKMSNKKKSNFNIVDVIEKKANINNSDEESTGSTKNTFIDSVKSHIDDFLEKLKQNNKIKDKNIMQLLEVKHNNSITQNSSNSILSNNNMLSSLKINKTSDNKRKMVNSIVSSYDDDMLSKIKVVDEITKLQSKTAIESNELKPTVPQKVQEYKKIDNECESIEKVNSEEIKQNDKVKEKNIMHLLEIKHNDNITQDTSNSILSNNNMLSSAKKRKMVNGIVSSCDDDMLNKIKVVDKITKLQSKTAIESNNLKPTDAQKPQVYKKIDNNECESIEKVNREEIKQNDKVKEKNIMHLLEIKHNDTITQDTSNSILSNNRMLSSPEKRKMVNDIINSCDDDMFSKIKVVDEITKLQSKTAIKSSDQKPTVPQKPQEYKKIDNNECESIEKVNSEEIKQNDKVKENNIMHLLEIKHNDNISQDTSNSILSNSKMLSSPEIRKMVNDIINSCVDNMLSKIKVVDEIKKLQSKTAIEINDLEPTVIRKAQEYKKSNNNELESIENVISDILMPSNTHQDLFTNITKKNDHLEPLLDFNFILNNNVKSNMNEGIYRANIPLKNTCPESKSLLPSLPLVTNIIKESDTLNEIENRQNIKETKLWSQVCDIDITPVVNTHHDAIQPYVNKCVDSTKTEKSDCATKISFTQTHLNFYSKNTPDLNYLIISKLNIDLDIIETKYEKNEDSVNIFKNEHQGVIQHKIIFHLPNLESRPNYTKPNKSSFNEGASSKESITYKIQNNIQNELNYPIIEPLQANYDTSLKMSPPSQESTVYNIQNNNYEVQLQEQQTDLQFPTDSLFPNKSTECLKKCTLQDSTTSKQNNPTVKDIIAKYKDIISSKLNASRQLEHQIPSSASGNKGISQNVKIKRPYKITDLPSLLQPNNQIKNSQTISQPTYRVCEVRKFDSKTEQNKEANKYEDNHGKVITNTQIDEYKERLDTKTPDQLSSIADIESLKFEQTDLLNDEFDISQKMFNPKSLLECLRQDEIIPPPSPFRDEEKTCSPNQNTETLNEVCTPPDQYYISRQQSLQNNTNILNLDSTDFSENKDMLLTPNKEIETWTLSKDDELYTNPYKSFTMIRNNNAVNFDWRVFPTRKAKLDEFKFSPKNVFKYRK